eukprot:Rhum_TRINITY_DN14693_c0_g1::Rhum_TRINITY_DN14693_c0_g1_i3::g.107863::m.107863
MRLALGTAEQRRLRDLVRVDEQVHTRLAVLEVVGVAHHVKRVHDAVRRRVPRVPRPTRRHRDQELLLRHRAVERLAQPLQKTHVRRRVHVRLPVEVHAVQVVVLQELHSHRAELVHVVRHLRPQLDVQPQRDDQLVRLAVQATNLPRAAVHGLEVRDAVLTDVQGQLVLSVRVAGVAGHERNARQVVQGKGSRGGNHRRGRQSGEQNAARRHACLSAALLGASAVRVWSAGPAPVCHYTLGIINGRCAWGQSPEKVQPASEFTTDKMTPKPSGLYTGVEDRATNRQTRCFFWRCDFAAPLLFSFFSFVLYSARKKRHFCASDLSTER